MPLKTDTPEAAWEALQRLKDARYYITQAYAQALIADAPKISSRLRSDLKAIDGAIHHARHRYTRAKAGRPMHRRGV